MANAAKLNKEDFVEDFKRFGGSRKDKTAVMKKLKQEKEEKETKESKKKAAEERGNNSKKLNTLNLCEKQKTSNKPNLC